MSGNLSAHVLKINTDLASHVMANAPAQPRGRIFQWFKDQIANAISGAAGQIDPPTFEATVKNLFDTVIKPNDGIPDFIDEILWSVVVLPLIDKLLKQHTMPPTVPPTV